MIPDHPEPEDMTEFTLDGNSKVLHEHEDEEESEGHVHGGDAVRDRQSELERRKSHGSLSAPTKLRAHAAGLGSASVPGSAQHAPGHDEGEGRFRRPSQSAHGLGSSMSAPSLGVPPGWGSPGARAGRQESGGGRLHLPPVGRTQSGKAQYQDEANNSGSSWSRRGDFGAGLEEREHAHLSSVELSLDHQVGSTRQYSVMRGRKLTAGSRNRDARSGNHINGMDYKHW